MRSSAGAGDVKLVLADLASGTFTTLGVTEREPLAALGRDGSVLWLDRDSVVVHTPSGKLRYLPHERAGLRPSVLALGGDARRREIGGFFTLEDRVQGDSHFARGRVLASFAGVTGKLRWQAELSNDVHALVEKGGMAAGRFDTDDVLDVAVTEGDERVVIYDGARGTPLRSLSVPGVSFFERIEAAPDGDGDRKDDLLFFGREVVLVSSESGAVLERPPRDPFNGASWRVVADVDGDGVADKVAADDRYVSKRVRVTSGATGTGICEIEQRMGELLWIGGDGRFVVKSGAAAYDVFAPRTDAADFAGLLPLRLGARTLDEREALRLVGLDQRALEAEQRMRALRVFVEDLALGNYDLPRRALRRPLSLPRDRREYAELAIRASEVRTKSPALAPTGRWLEFAGPPRLVEKYFSYLCLQTAWPSPMERALNLAAATDRCDAPVHANRVAMFTALVAANGGGFARVSGDRDPPAVRALRAAGHPGQLSPVYGSGGQAAFAMYLDFDDTSGNLARVAVRELARALGR
jgi:hypothetical protein